MRIGFLKDLLQREKRMFVFLGESGSGKSELAINLALALSKVSKRKIHFFDMDQSKPLYRSRDLREVMEEKNIEFHAGEQYLDSPLVPHGIESIMREKEDLVIFDIGGNSIGATNIGQYADYFNQEETNVFFVMNYYRAFSKTEKHVRETIQQVLQFARIEKVEFISNPNFGRSTSGEDIVYGHKAMCKMLERIGHEVKILAMNRTFMGERFEDVSEEIMLIQPVLNSL